MDAIKSIESGGDYNAQGASGEFGAYQFMPDTWASWSKEVFGEPVQPTPENQDRVARAKIQEWVKQGYDPRQVASLWNSGKPDWSGNKGVNDQGVEYDTPAYVQKFEQEFQKTEPGGQGQKGRLIRLLKKPFTEEMSRARVKSGVDEIAQRIQQRNEQGILDFLSDQAEALGDAARQVGRTGPPLSREERLQDLEETVHMQRVIGNLRGDKEALARADRLADKIVRERSKLERKRAELREKGQRSMLGSAQGPAQAGVVKEDVSSLGKVLKEGAKNVARNTLHAGEGLADFFGEMQQEAWNRLPDKTKQELLRSREQGREGLFISKETAQEFGEKFREVAEEKIGSKDIKYGTGANKWLRHMLTVGPQVGTQILATYLGGPAAGIATIGTQIGGQTYDELKKQGVDPVKAFRASAVNAASQGALEQIGIGRALRGWNPGLGAKAALADLTGRFGTEWFTEFAQAFPDTITKLWGKSEDTDDFVKKLADTDWAEVMAQGAYEGTLTAPYAGLGMALSAKADRQGRIPGIDPDEILPPEQSRDLPPRREGIEGPYIDVEGRPVAGPGQAQARRERGAQPHARGQFKGLENPQGTVKGQLIAPLEGRGQRGLPAATRGESSGRTIPVPPEQQEPGTEPIEAGGPARLTDQQQRIIDQIRQKIQGGTLDRSTVVGRKGGEIITQVTRQGQDQQLTMQPDGTGRRRQGLIPEEEWDEILVDARPKAEPRQTDFGQQDRADGTYQTETSPHMTFTRKDGKWFDWTGKRYKGRKGLPSVQDLEDFAQGRGSRSPLKKIRTPQGETIKQGPIDQDYSGLDMDAFDSETGAEARPDQEGTDADIFDQVQPQNTPQAWLQNAFASGMDYADIMWDLDRATQAGELTHDQGQTVADALMDFDERVGRGPTAQDLDEILAMMESRDYSRQEAQGNAELSAESVEQINTIRDMELDLYQKGVKRIKDMGGLNSAHARYEFGHEEMMELNRKFGKGIIKKNGLSLDVVAQALAQESPELGIEPGGDIASLYDFLMDRAKSKAQIEQDYKHALNSLQQSDEFSVGESDARYEISRTRRSDRGQSRAAAPRKGYLHSAKRVPGQKSLLDLYQPEQKPHGQKGMEGLKDPETIADEAIQMFGPQVEQVRIGTFSHGGGPIRSGQDVARLVRPLGKKAQENLCMVCLDAKKQPIAVLRHTIGSDSASQAYAQLMLGSVYEIPGTSSFWMVHNHPAGSSSQSGADQNLVRIIYDYNHIGGAPKFEGSVVVTDQGQGSAITPKEGFQEETFTITPNLESSTQTVPLLEREYSDFQGQAPGTINQPEDITRFLQDQGLDREDGIIFLNSKNTPVAHVKLSKGEMLKLRAGGTGGKVGAGVKLYRAMARSNANTIIPHTTSTYTEGAADMLENIKGFAKSNGVRVLDLIVDGQSMFKAGKYYGNLHKVQMQFEEPVGKYGKGDQGGPPRIPGNPDRLLGQFNNLPVKKFMGGGNADENVNEALRNMRAQAKRKGSKLDLSDDDISFIRAHTSLPYWLAKDDADFARVYQVQQERVQARNVTREALLEEARPFLEARSKLNRRQRRKLNQLIRKLDRERIKPMTVEFDRVVQELGVDNQVAEAYMSARRVLDFIWHEHMPAVLKELGHTDNEIEQYRRETGNVDGYWPRRRKGRYYIKASKGDQALYREHFNDIIATLTKGKVSPKLKAKQKRLKKDYPGTRLSAGKVTRLTDEVYFQVSPEAMEQVIDAALQSRQAREAGAGTEEMRSAIKSAVADVFKQRGFMAHGIQRQDVEGYDTSDPWQDLVEYISGYAGFVTKLRAAPEFTAALRQIPAKDKENLYLYSTKYVRDVMQVADAFDQAVDRARGVMFHWYLGGSIKSAVLNLTQNWIGGVPVLRQYTGLPEKEIAQEMTKAMTRVVRDIGNKVAGRDKEPAWQRVLPQDVTAGLNRARKKGVIDDQYTQELLGTTLTSFGSKLRKVENASRFFFGTAEIINRESMWLAAYNLAKKKGLYTEAAYDFAEQIVQDTHFAYGQGSLPPFARGGKPAKVARSMYTFRSYTHNLLSLYRHLGKNHQGMSLGRALLYLLAFGGLGGIPLYESLERRWQKMTGENIRSEVSKEVSGWKEDLVKYGLPGLADIDLSGSISIEVPTSVKDIPGVPVDMFWTRLNQVSGDIARDDYWRAMEDFAPTAIANPLKAYRLHRYGQTTRGGAPVRNDQGEQVKLTPMEAVRKGLGFQPIKNSEGFRRWQARTEAMQHWQERKYRLLDAFHRAGQRGGYQSAKVKEIIKEIEKFNKEVPAYVAPITRRTLRARLRGPSRREEAAMQEFQ
jgi:hypothetical protein